MANGVGTAVGLTTFREVRQTELCMCDRRRSPKRLATTMSRKQLLRCQISADLERIRGVVRGHARQAGLSEERLEDLVLAVNEAVTNVLDHGGATGTVTTRVGPGVVTVEITDHAGTLSAEH